MERFIIEHPTRGTLKFLVSEHEYAFSTTGSRNDPDRTLQMFSLREAQRVLGKLPDRHRRDCMILHWIEPAPRKYGEWKEVYP